MPAGMQVTAALVKKTPNLGSWGAIGQTANVALAGFPITGITVGEPVGENIVDTTWGNAQPKDADAGTLNLAGDITAFARFDSLTLPLALVMGIAGTPVTVGVGGREHTLRWANSIEGINATMAMDLITSIDEFPSLKFGGFVLHQIVGQPADLTFNVIANTKRYSTDTTDLPVNIAPFPSLVTTTSPRYRLMGHHCRVRGNLVSDPLLAPAHELCFNEFTLTVSRGLVGDFCFNGSRIMDEPELDAVPTATLTMNWPVHRAQSDQWLRWAKSDSEVKIDITYTHPDPNGAGTAFPFVFRIDIPRGRIGGPAKGMTGPGRISYNHTVQLLKPDVASAGMTGLLDFIGLFLRNKTTANPLA
jgi:hypothetical protein